MRSGTAETAGTVATAVVINQVVAIDSWLSSYVNKHYKCYVNAIIVVGVRVVGGGTFVFFIIQNYANINNSECNNDKQKTKYESLLCM